MTVIYADTVFVLNWLLDYLLLLSTVRLTAVPFQRPRLMFAAAIGGFYAVAVFLPPLWFLNHPLFRLLSAILMAAAAFGLNRRFARLCAVFFAVSGALAGLLVTLSLLSSSSEMFPKGIPASKIDGKALLLAGAICYWTSSLLMRRLIPEQGAELVPVKLVWQDRSAEITVLVDSGNLLTDAKGNSVLVTDWRYIRTLLPDKPELTADVLSCPIDCLARIGSAWGAGRLHLLPYHSVGESRGMLLALRIDYAMIGSRMVPDQLIAFTSDAVFSGRYQGIIGTSHFIREDHHERNLHSAYQALAAQAQNPCGSER